MAVLRKINKVSDARRIARQSLPKGLFDYIDGGAEGETTMAANERAFETVTFRPRAGEGLPAPSLETTVLGTTVSLPVLLAPCGLVQLMHPDGALGAARAAHDMGTISILSTFAGTPPETLSNEPSPRWFQLYATDREMADDLIGRAKGSGYDALVVTMDSATAGKRERNSANGANTALDLNFRNVMRLAPQVVSRPRWGVRMVATSWRTLTKSTLPGSGVSSPMSPPGRGGSGDGPVQTPARGAPPLVSPFTWDDIAWVRQQWSGPLIVKSILTGTDAKKAVDCGADAVVVSNHGGRQLESAPATLTVLPEVVDAVGSSAEVLIDSGVRRGGDVVKAIALGARAVLIGRPYLYGLAAAGQPGVRRILKILQADMARTMALLGCHSVADLDTTWLQPAESGSE